MRRKSVSKEKFVEKVFFVEKCVEKVFFKRNASKKCFFGEMRRKSGIPFFFKKKKRNASKKCKPLNLASKTAQQKCPKIAVYLP